MKLASTYLGVDEELVNLALTVATLLCPELYRRKNASQSGIWYCTTILLEFLKNEGSIESQLIRSCDFDTMMEIIKHYDPIHCHNYTQKLKIIEQIVKKMDSTIYNRNIPPIE